MSIEDFPKTVEEKRPYCQTCGGEHSTKPCPKTKEVFRPVEKNKIPERKPSVNPESIIMCKRCHRTGHESSECYYNVEVECDVCGGKHKTTEHNLVFEKTKGPK